MPMPHASATARPTASRSRPASTSAPAPPAAGSGGSSTSLCWRCWSAQGFTQAIAAITLPNDASVRLHERLGFEPPAPTGRWAGSSARWHDVGLWQRALARPATRRRSRSACGERPAKRALVCTGLRPSSPPFAGTLFPRKVELVSVHPRVPNDPASGRIGGGAAHRLVGVRAHLPPHRSRSLSCARPRPCRSRRRNRARRHAPPSIRG